jgi:hypothetical protein
MECYEIFDDKFLESFNGEMFCPKTNCSGDVIELDELIAPTIILLNQKGYYTKFCCSSHWYEEGSTAYIYFYEDCLPETISPSFKQNVMPNVIRATYNDKSESKYDFAYRVNKELYEWAKSLPETE